MIIFKHAWAVFATSLLVLILGSHPLPGYGQTPLIDSLKQRLRIPGNERVSILFSLCWQGESMPSDSLKNFAEEALRASLLKHDRAGVLKADFFLARALNFSGKPDSALAICEEGLDKNKDWDNFYKELHLLLWQKIACLTKLRKMQESLKTSYQLVESGEKYHDLNARVNGLNYIGVNYSILRNRPEAEKWFQKAYHLIGDSSRDREFPLVFTSLATCYYLNSQYDSSNFFLNRAFQLARENQNLRSLSDCYTLKAQHYSLENKPDSAERMLQEAVLIQKHIGNLQFIMVGLDALENFYGNQKNYDKAITYIREAQHYAIQYHEPMTLSMYQDLALCFQLKGDYKRYGLTLDTLMNLKDSMYKKNRSDELARLEAQYELSSKDAFISRQQLELLHKDIYLGIGLVLFLSLVATGIILFRRYRRRQYQLIQEANEKERRRIAADFHDNIGAYAAAISSGIDHIENRKLIGDPAVIRHLKENATQIITSLRDTIWVLDNQSITLTAIGDRIKNYISRIEPAYPIINIEMEENLQTEKMFTPMQALNIFRIFQEALHNALEHSYGDQIVVSLNSYERLTELTITDNGVGFDMDSVRHLGNGLTNMQRRATEAGFQMKMGKAGKKGTQIKLSQENIV